MENSREKNKKSASQKQAEFARTRKAWTSPKLIVESVESTKGGTISCNNPGDDTWYKS